jgi:hypothetical protein
MYMSIYTYVPKKMKKKLSLEIQNISYEDEWEREAELNLVFNTKYTL